MSAYHDDASRSDDVQSSHFTSGEQSPNAALYAENHILSESDFHQLAEQTMRQLESAVSLSDLPIEDDYVAGTLTLTFPSGQKLILTKQTPLRELWLAMPGRGIHFQYTGQKTGSLWQHNGETVEKAINAFCVLSVGAPLIRE